MLCPVCRKPVLAVTREWNTRRNTVKVEIHHEEDAKRWSVGASTRTCVAKMSFDESQKLMGKVAARA